MVGLLTSFLLPALLRGGGEGYNRVVFSAATFNPVSYSTKLCQVLSQMGALTTLGAYTLITQPIYVRPWEH